MAIKTHKISIDDIKKLKDARKKLKNDSKILDKRVDYIYRTMFKALEIKNHYWYYPGNYDYCDRDDEGIPSSLNILDMLNANNKWMHFEVDVNESFSYGKDKGFYADDNSCILDKNGGEIQLYDGFPKRWLFEDFEQELINGRKAYLAKSDNKTQKKLDLKKRALEKLTSEEKKALGLE